MARILIDTSVLVQAHDVAHAVRRERAIAALAGVHASGAGCLSAQVLGEFFCAVTGGAKPRLSVQDAGRQVDRLARAWAVLEVTAFVVGEAHRGVAVHGMSYRDGQVWATARLNQVPVVFSDRFGSGGAVEGVRFVDPLGEGFEVGNWV